MTVLNHPKYIHDSNHTHSLTLCCPMTPYGVMRLSASLCHFQQCQGGTEGGGWVGVSACKHRDCSWARL